MIIERSFKPETHLLKYLDVGVVFSDENGEGLHLLVDDNDELYVAFDLENDIIENWKAGSVVSVRKAKLVLED